MSNSKPGIFLFLDDDAFHPDGYRSPSRYYPLIGAEHILERMNGMEVVMFTTVEDAQSYVTAAGCPAFISFDNDLQRPLEGIHFAHWLVEQDIQKEGRFIPDDFSFFVHSQNIVAKRRIQSYLDQYLDLRRKEKSISHAEGLDSDAGADFDGSNGDAKALDGRNSGKPTPRR